MSAKTTNGVSACATHRSNREHRVATRLLRVGADFHGLTTVLEVGDGRGYVVHVTVSAEEMAAWLPELLDVWARQKVDRAEWKIRGTAARMARELGVTLPFVPGVDFDDL